MVAAAADSLDCFPSVVFVVYMCVCLCVWPEALHPEAMQIADAAALELAKQVGSLLIHSVPVSVLKVIPNLLSICIAGGELLASLGPAISQGEPFSGCRWLVPGTPNR